MKNRKFIYGIIFILLLSFFISGCGAKKDASYDTPSAQNEYGDRGEGNYDDSDISMAPDNYSDEEDTDFDDGSIEPEKIITTISITMQTKEFMDATSKLNNLIKKHKGYIEQSNISYNNYVYDTQLKYSDYRIRIPRNNLDLFVNELKEIGNIISENKNKTDITKQYRDTESRLRVLETKEERILDLLKRAEKMEDIITLENKLSDIIYEKETYTANIIDMDNKVDYGTVDFQLEEVAKLTTSGTVKTPFSDKVKDAFNDSIYFFTNAIQNLIISFIYLLPYLIIILVVVFIIFIIIRKTKKKLPENKNPDNENKDSENKDNKQ